jgi:hypothetical protein
MKIIALLISLSFSNFLLSQTDIDYFFQKGQSLIDIRNQEVILTDLPVNSRIIEETDHFKVLIGDYGVYQMRKYTKDFKLLWTIGERNCNVSPDWSFLFIVEKGDLYKKNINWQNGTIGDAVKFTELGVFKSPSEYAVWNDKYYFFEMSRKTYRLDTNTGEIIETIFPACGINIKNRLSPGRNYFLNGNTVIDLNSNTLVNSKRLKPKGTITEFIRWIDDTTFLAMNSQNRKKIRIAKYSVLDIYNPVSEINVDNLSNVVPANNEIGFHGNYSSYSELLKRSAFKNTDNDYLLMRPRSYFGNHPVYLVSLQDGSNELLTETAKGFVGGDLVSERISKDEFMFASAGEILKQGTFIINLTTKEREKILNYPATAIWNFKGTDYLLISANNEFYRYNKTTKSLEEIQLKAKVKEVTLVSEYSYFNIRR